MRSGMTKYLDREGNFIREEPHLDFDVPGEEEFFFRWHPSKTHLYWMMRRGTGTVVRGFLVSQDYKLSGVGDGRWVEFPTYGPADVRGAAAAEIRRYRAELKRRHDPTAAGPTHPASRLAWATGLSLPQAREIYSHVEASGKFPDIQDAVLIAAYQATKYGAKV